jgi:hypothetical protein
MDGACSTHAREMTKTFKILVREARGGTSLGRARHRWEDNINMDLKEIWWESMDCIQLL